MPGKTNEETQIRYLAVRQKTKIKLISLDLIYYFHSSNKYTIVRTANEQFLITEPLNKLEKNQATSFLRIHRNALISPQYIDVLEKDEGNWWWIGFRDIEDKLKISRRYAPSIRRYLR